MMRIPIANLALGAVIAATAVTGTAHAFDPLTWYSFDSGGTAFATGGSYRLGGTIGQSDAARLAGGAYELRGGFWFGGVALATDVEDGAPAPLVFRLYRGPNPVRSRSRLSFDLPTDAKVRVTIFDVTGRAAKRLDLGLLAAGHQEHGWRSEDDDGRPLPSGVYYLRLEAGRERATQKVVILR